MHQQEITQSNIMQLKNINVELPNANAYEKHKNLHVLHGDTTSKLFVIIKHSESRTLLKILALASIIALLIVVFAGVLFGGTNFRDNDNLVLPSKNYLKLISSHKNIASVNMNSIPLLVFQDLANEGMLTINDKSLIVSSNKEQAIEPTRKAESLTISPSDKKQQNSIRDESYTFSYTDSYDATIGGFLDRTLKIGGVMVVQLSRDPSLSFEVPPNYKIVYFRKFTNCTFIAMRKLASDAIITSSSRSTTHGKLLQLSPEEKKAILEKLEDVLLEPPRSATMKSKTYLRKMKFLPNLLNDSLEGYSRRVYIDVGGDNESTRWFEQHYPKRNKHFDMYRLETVSEVDSNGTWKRPPTQMGITDWLWRNVKPEEYLVMKANDEVVEEMLKSKAIALVNELFLECKPFGKGGGSKRAYWECLDLYGRLRDFGVVVHQWWG